MAILGRRSYDGDADLQVMIRLLIEARPSERLGDFPSISDLREMLGVAELQSNTGLWKDAAGNLLAFALIDPRFASLSFEMAQIAHKTELAAQIIEWGAAIIRNAAQGRPDAPLSLNTMCNEANAERIALLARLGFAPQAWHTLHMACPLNVPLPFPRLPDGYIIRHVAGRHEADAVVALHRAAFGTANMTVEYRLAMMDAPDYEPELDLVAIAPDGRFVAYCMCSTNREANALSGRKDGYTDPVATHPSSQRMGLARALLHTGLRLLQETGIEMAWLSTSSENLAMQRTAFSAGYYRHSSTIPFTMSI